MVQGGWAEPKTVLTHYRRSIGDRRRAAVYKTFNVPPEVPRSRATTDHKTGSYVRSIRTPAARNTALYGDRPP